MITNTIATPRHTKCPVGTEDWLQSVGTGKDWGLSPGQGGGTGRDWALRTEGCNSADDSVCRGTRRLGRSQSPVPASSRRRTGMPFSLEAYTFKKYSAKEQAELHV